MNMKYLAVAAGAFLVLKSRDSGNGKPAIAAKHPAFTYPQNQTMDGQTEDALVNAIFAHRGVNKETATMNDGSIMTYPQLQQILGDLNWAIGYYTDRSQRNIEQLDQPWRYDWWGRHPNNIRNY